MTWSAILRDFLVALRGDGDHVPLAAPSLPGYWRASSRRARGCRGREGSRAATTTTGMFSSIRAIGPCFISPAG